MAEKSSEEFPSESANNTTETATPSSSKNMADKNDENISGAICTISPSLRKMPGKSYSFNDPDPKTRKFIEEIVRNFFVKINRDKYKFRLNYNNEPNVYAANDNIRRNTLVAYTKCKNLEDINGAMRNLKFVFNLSSFKELSLNGVTYSAPKLQLSSTLTPRLNLDVDFIKHGEEYIDFMSVFTEFDFCKPFLEKVFSYLSYKDITSMTTVSTTWREAVLKSVNAGKELERVFIHAILYFCHRNANVTDEYKQLFENMLIHFKNQIEFKKNDF